MNLKELFALGLVASCLLSLAFYAAYVTIPSNVILCERIGFIDARDAPKYSEIGPHLSAKEEAALESEKYCNKTELFAKENERRLSWIDKHCKLMNAAKLSSQSEIFFFKKSNLGWCPVFKAASSNVFAQFCSDYHPETICKDKNRNGATLYRGSALFKEPDIKLWEDKRFVVVRDPLRRLLSAYRDKMEQLRETVFKKPAGEMMLHHRPIRWNMKFYRDKSSEQAINYAESMTENKVTTVPDTSNPYLYPPYPTFKEFVAEIIAGWGNPHIVPATQYCGPCSSTKKFDFIIKVETFDCDMGQMLNIINNKTAPVTGFSQEKWATNKGPAGNITLLYSYYSTLSIEQLEALHEYYQDDCQLYQYPCRELISQIRTFKLLNPNHKHQYRYTWVGRTLS